MIRLSAHLSMLFPEHDLIGRIRAAARCGFKGVEVAFPYDVAPALVREGLEEAGVVMVLINTPPGRFEAGERGLAGLPGREQEFSVQFHQALATARALGCRQIHVMAGIASPDHSAEHHVDTFTANLQWAAPLAHHEGIRVLIEPINQRSVPGYILSSLDLAQTIVDQVDHPNLALQFDVFHMQIVGGDLVKRFETVLPRVAHVQIAGVPDRHEPDDSEVNIDYVLRRMDELGYQGWIGCEYNPRHSTDAGLAWANRYGIGTPFTVDRT